MFQFLPRSEFFVLRVFSPRTGIPRGFLFSYLWKCTWSDGKHNSSRNEHLQLVVELGVWSTPGTYLTRRGAWLTRPLTIYGGLRRYE